MATAPPPPAGRVKKLHMDSLGGKSAHRGIARPGENDWMQQALCRLQHSGYFTGDTQPDPDTLQILRLICAQCPVAAQCADYALRNECQLGMYAGIWLGNRNVGHRTNYTLSRRWKTARAELSRIAGGVR
jgi:hypothetical protein